MDFQYQIKRSRRKTLGLYVKDGQVEVRAPMRTPEKTIHQWVGDKSQWVAKQLVQQQRQQQEKPRLEHKGFILFLGEHRPLELIEGKPAIYEKDRQLIIARTRNTCIKTLLEKWLRCEAESYLSQRTLELAEEMGESARLRDIRFRKTRSKWGHCTAERIIQYNWYIIMAPPAVIDYLIIHELSHLQQMNHSPAFWQRVEHFCPDYRRHKAWLKDNGHKLWL